MDLFSWYASAPLRIEFFDIEVESLREFDIDTQVSVRKLKQVEIAANEPTEDATVRDYMQTADRWLCVEGETHPNSHGHLHQGGSSDALCIGSPLGTFGAGDFILNETRRNLFFQQITEWEKAKWDIYITFSNKGEHERFEELVDQEFFRSGTITPLSGDLVQSFTLPSAKLAFLSSACLLYTSPSPRDQRGSRMPSSA